ncbi:MOSC N-terminal beta barrel domain-containing protein [Pseudoroseomonas wenyumeiae]
MRVETLYRYPVKGLTAEALEETTLRAGECIPNDRRFALAQGTLLSTIGPRLPAQAPFRLPDGE